jgi:hypothetical protein
MYRDILRSRAGRATRRLTLDDDRTWPDYDRSVATE